MKRTVIALIAGTFAAGAGAGQALADPSPPPAMPSQTVAQAAGNSQWADSSANSTQIKPENTNFSVRVLSPGSSGNVSQSNSSAAAAIAANANKLAQDATQTSGGGNPGHGTPIQGVGQVAESKQGADASAESIQVKPRNTNVSVRVLSPGDDGDVTQENSSTALALSLNKNDTTQAATQNAGGGSPLQTAAQVAKNHQDAGSTAESKQIEPENVNISVRVLSDGKNGSVSQKNSSKAIGVGANLNHTEQTTTQTGDGYGTSLQDAGQLAYSKQDADAHADSIQIKPKNTNVSVRVLSPGDDGDVTQENTSFALGIAANANDTKQTVMQEQDGRYGDVAVQAVGQKASNDQDAWASADSVQIKPENANLSVDTLGHDRKGHDPKREDREDGNAVSQKNTSAALSLSLNVNHLVQAADQSRGGVRELEAPKEYEHDSARRPDYEPKDPKEDDGGVSQLNKSLAAAISANFNHTSQTADQSQDGKGDLAVQAVGQLADNEQKARSKADSFQYGARNENGSSSGPELCKHDWCKPDKRDECKHDRCKPDWKQDKHDRCKPDSHKRHDWKRDRCKPKRCEPRFHKQCKDERRPVPLEAR